MNFILQLLKGFIRSGVNQVGRDGGKVISNKVYRNSYSEPIRLYNKDDIFKDEDFNSKLDKLCLLINISKLELINIIKGEKINININIGIDLNNFKRIYEEILVNTGLDVEYKIRFKNFYNQIVRSINSELKKINLIEKYGEIQGNNLFKGIYELGITEQILIDSKGEPSKIETEVLKTKTKKTYIYGNKSSGDIFIFENGLLTKIIDR